MVVPRSYPFGFRSVTYPSQYCRALGPKFFTCSFLPYKTISIYIYIYIYIFFFHMFVSFFGWWEIGVVDGSPFIATTAGEKAPCKLG